MTLHCHGRIERIESKFKNSAVEDRAQDRGCVRCDGLCWDTHRYFADFLITFSCAIYKKLSPKHNPIHQQLLFLNHARRLQVTIHDWTTRPLFVSSNTHA